MSKGDIHQKLNKAFEITLSVKGRKSGKDVRRPVWFVHEDNVLFLLPVQGSDTNWYKNLLVHPLLKISLNGLEISEIGKLITDNKSVNDIVKKFRSKYGEDVKRYYPKTDVAVQVSV